MTRRPYPLLASLAVLAAGALIGACGRGGGANSTQTTTAGSTTTSTTSTPSPASPSQNLSALVAVCRREVASAGVLTPAERLQLDNVCTVAATGDRARVRDAEHRVCLTVLRDSAPGLSGPAFRAARQSCNRL